MREILKILREIFMPLVGIFFIAGGLSGNLVFKGTESGGLLAIVGAGMLIYGIYRLATYKSRNQKETAQAAAQVTAREEHLAKTTQRNRSRYSDR